MPDKVLLDDMRKTAKRLGKRTLGRLEYNSEGTFSCSTIYRRFGSWNRAIRLAGLQIQKHANVSKLKLLENMKKVWDSLGRQPGIKEMVKPVSEHGGETYSMKFGSWHAALEEFIRHVPGGQPHVIMPRFTRKRKKAGKINITKSLRYDILKRDRFRCRLCGASPAVNPHITLHVDHIKPRSKNGETVCSNLQTLCSDCNYGKSNK